MEVIKLGDPARIWHGTETCKHCGSMVRIKKYEIENKPAETWVGGIRRMVGSLRWWNCVVCGGRNALGPETEGTDQASSLPKAGGATGPSPDPPPP